MAYPSIPYASLIDQWITDLESILRSTLDTSEFDALWKHVNRFWTLRQDNYPEIYSTNRESLDQAAVEFIDSMSDEQRKAVSRRLGKLSRSILEISEDISSTEPDFHPEQSCYSQSL